MRERGDADLVYSYSELIDENDNSLNRTIKDNRKMISTEKNCIPYIFFGTIYGHTILFDRKYLEYIIPFPKITGHDLWIAFVISTMGKIKNVDLPLVKYRMHSNNVAGAIGFRKNNDKPSLYELNDRRRKLTELYLGFYKKVTKNNNDLTLKTLEQLYNTYESPSFINRLKRTIIIFKHRKDILAPKKHNALRRFIFCFKTPFKIY
jgi:hypothetical protein